MVGIALVILAAPLAVRAGNLVYSGALQFATGDYIFTDRTNSIYLMNGLFLSVGPAHLSVSVPVIYQNTSLVSNSGPGMIPSGGEGSDGVRQHRHGGQIHVTATNDFREVEVGDPLARADLEVLEGGNRSPSISVAALAKPPVASVQRGFGTGKWDYGAGLSVAHVIHRYVASASMIYWVMGDPAGVDFENPIAYSIAIGRPLANSKFSALLSLSGYTQIVENTDPFRQLGILLTYWLTTRRNLNGSIIFGLTESTPDVGLSIGWGITL